MNNVPKNFGVIAGPRKTNEDKVIVDLSRNLRKSPRLAQLFATSFEQVDPTVRLQEVDLENGIVELIAGTREHDLFRILMNEAMSKFNSRRSKGEHKFATPANSA